MATKTTLELAWARPEAKDLLERLKNDPEDHTTQDERCVDLVLQLHSEWLAAADRDPHAFSIELAQADVLLDLAAATASCLKKLFPKTVAGKAGQQVLAGTKIPNQLTATLWLCQCLEVGLLCSTSSLMAVGSQETTELPASVKSQLTNSGLPAALGSACTALAAAITHEPFLKLLQQQVKLQRQQQQEQQQQVLLVYMCVADYAAYLLLKLVTMVSLHWREQNLLFRGPLAPAVGPAATLAAAVLRLTCRTPGPASHTSANAPSAAAAAHSTASTTGRDSSSSNSSSTNPNTAPAKPGSSPSLTGRWISTTPALTVAAWVSGCVYMESSLDLQRDPEYQRVLVSQDVLFLVLLRLGCEVGMMHRQLQGRSPVPLPAADKRALQVQQQQDGQQRLQDGQLLVPSLHTQLLSALGAGWAEHDEAMEELPQGQAPVAAAAARICCIHCSLLEQQQPSQAPYISPSVSGPLVFTLTELAVLLPRPMVLSAAVHTVYVLQGLREQQSHKAPQQDKGNAALLQHVVGLLGPAVLHTPLASSSGSSNSSSGGGTSSSHCPSASSRSTGDYSSGIVLRSSIVFVQLEIAGFQAWEDSDQWIQSSNFSHLSGSQVQDLIHGCFTGVLLSLLLHEVEPTHTATAWFQLPFTATAALEAALRRQSRFMLHGMPDEESLMLEQEAGASRRKFEALRDPLLLSGTGAITSAFSHGCRAQQLPRAAADRQQLAPLLYSLLTTCVKAVHSSTRIWCHTNNIWVVLDSCSKVMAHLIDQEPALLTDDDAFGIPAASSTESPLAAFDPAGRTAWLHLFGRWLLLAGDSLARLPALPQVQAGGSFLYDVEFCGEWLKGLHAYVHNIRYLIACLGQLPAGPVGDSKAAAVAEMQQLLSLVTEVVNTVSKVQQRLQTIQLGSSDNKSGGGGGGPDHQPEAQAARDSTFKQLLCVELASKLQQFGARLAAAFPSRLVCNNPACVHLKQLSELQLVGSGGGAVVCDRQGKKSAAQCSGCKTAKFCCRECQVAAWKGHKAACKRLQACLQQG